MRSGAVLTAALCLAFPAQAGVMAFATYGTFASKGIHWMWNFGGIEYIAFWGIASFALAVHAWKAILSDSARAAVPAHA